MTGITLAITPGDPDGVGPEVTKKALIKLKSSLKRVSIVIFARKFTVPKELKIQFIEPFADYSPGKVSGWAIEEAVKFVRENPEKRALVTGPINKERLRSAGYPFNGHTDFLASLTNTKEVTMVLANDLFRVALVTNHCPLKEVSSKISLPKILKTIEHVANFAQGKLKKKKPLVAVLGLNPHAGENGVLGDEEKNVIIPAIKYAQNKFPDLTITGPHPADSFFATEKIRIKQKKGHDFVIAQYHDQGLIPVKLSDFSNSLNLTLGLPILRTSVDHGVAFDIAGKNKADPGSMIYAIRKALEFL